MPVVAVVGGQWGDEGKGKIIDLLAEEAEFVIRSQGGDNAGHTVVNPLGEFALHLVPCGVFNPAVICIIAPGVALNPAILLEEMDRLERRGVSTRGLLLSDRTQMVMPHHLLLDRALENQRADDPIGVTLRGIGPAYADKVARVGLRVGDLRDDATLETKVRAAVERANGLLMAAGSTLRADADQTIQDYKAYAERLRPMIRDVAPLIADAVARDATILLEGAQGTLLDLDHGNYPYVTGSSCTVAGLLQGVGIPPRAFSRAIGVYKAYSTRVGSGPLPTELLDATGDYIREHAHEFGATTCRARRVGWFDSVVSRYTIALNGFDAIALTRIDMLDEMDSVKLCTAYELDGERLELPPSNLDLHARCRPVYEELPGWKQSTRGAATFEELPTPTRRFIERIEELLHVPIHLIGLGPERSECIVREPLWPVSGA